MRVDDHSPAALHSHRPRGAAAETRATAQGAAPMARHLIVAALAIGALLAACGQRGPLYLPAGSAQPSPAPRTPVLPTPLLPVPPLTSDPAPLPAPEIPTPDDPMTAPASSRTPNNTPSTSSTPAGQ